MSSVGGSEGEGWDNEYSFGRLLIGHRIGRKDFMLVRGYRMEVNESQDILHSRVSMSSSDESNLWSKCCQQLSL